jgi:hypothetical protein
MSPSRVKNFLFSMLSRPAIGHIQSSIQWLLGSRFPGVKWPERKADDSHPTIAKIKKTWIYISTPPYFVVA